MLARSGYFDGERRGTEPTNRRSRNEPTKKNASSNRKKGETTVLIAQNRLHKSSYASSVLDNRKTMGMEKTSVLNSWAD